LKIALVSRSWPSDQHSGVSLIAAEHVKILSECGYDISIIGSNKSVLNEVLPVSFRFYIASRGSGSLYSPKYVDCSSLMCIFLQIKPDLIIVEGWQTALTESTIDISYKMGIPITMISHGISLHPYTDKFIDHLRAIAWLYYKNFKLPKLISKLSLLTTLDMNSNSNRFYDRELAKKLKVPISLLVNHPVSNFNYSLPSFYKRKRQVLVIGYFSRVKNQLFSIDVFAGLPDDLHLRFIGHRKGLYFGKCLARVEELGLQNRVSFIQDNECDIATEIASSLIVLCNSITEALPVTLIEAMANGTPFVSEAVGAIPTMGGGITARYKNEFQDTIRHLVNNENYWTCISEKGVKAYESSYTKKHTRKNLLDAIEIAIKKKYNM